MKEAILDVSKIDEAYEGKVKVEVLKFRQRLAYGKDLKFKTDDSGEVVIDDNMMDLTLKMIELTEKHFLDIDVKHRESGLEAKSFEELEDNPEFDPLVPALCGAVLNAGRVGKP